MMKVIPMNKYLSNNLLEIFTHLKYQNASSYLVGGCVRDYLIGKTPKDFDIVTDCPIETLIPILEDNNWKINEAGKQFFVLIASKGNEQYEIANFRKDGTYIDGRRPSSVDIGSIQDDATRRDLSINSLYYNPYVDEILDPTSNGLDDIKNKLIRMNGKPESRIKEDLLRIMRVYRFSKQLGFEIHKKTLVACRTHFSEMTKTIPGERIMSEVEKMVF